MLNEALPTQWVWASLGEIAYPIREQVAPMEQPEREFNYLSIQNVESNTGRLVGFSPTAGSNIRSAKFLFTPNDVLYSKLRPYLNKVYLPTFDGVSATDLLPIRPRAGISREYLAHFLRTHEVVEYSNQHMRGIQLPRLAVEDLLSLQVPVPPSREQTRIVRKVDEVTQQLRIARQSIGRVPSTMEQFRQSILSRAFRGKLTEYNLGDEPAKELLERIREARKQKGKALRPKQEDGYSRFANTTTDIPNTWIWSTLAEVTESSFYGPRFAKDDYRETGVMTVRTTDMDEDGNIVLNNPPRIQLNDSELNHFGLHEGDLLVTRSGSIGKCAVFTGMEPAIPSAYLIRLRLMTEFILPKYVLYYLLSPTGQKLLRLSSTAVTQSNVNAESVKMFLIPLCSREEQRRVVRRVEQLIETGRIVGRTAKSLEKTIAAIEQAVLTSAFRGKLVPQDPNDEPASVLLERIKNAQTESRDGVSRRKPKPRRK